MWKSLTMLNLITQLYFFIFHNSNKYLSKSSLKSNIKMQKSLPFAGFLIALAVASITLFNLSADSQANWS